MSDQDQDSSKWQLGMQLPSRKETHGRKKKSDRKLDEPKPASKPASKQKRDRYIEAIPEDPKYAVVPVPEEQDAIKQLQAYWNESAATAAPPIEESEPLTDELYLRELLANPDKVQEAVDQHAVSMIEEPAPAVVKLPSTFQPEIVPDAQLETTESAVHAEPEATTDATIDEEETAPVISKWKIVLLILFTPIILVIVLAWGKLAYVHRVPDFVQQEVPAYQQGQGFLILKPWWFGPPIFTLDQYERTDGEDFTHWSIQLNDYSAVVHDPTVLYTFPEDILK